MDPDTIFKLFMAGLALIVVIGIVLCATGVLKFENSDEEEAERRAQRQAESLAGMNTRSIVAGFIQRGDFLHLSEKGFAEWLDLNKGFVFPHELETMEKQRAAQHDDVQPHKRRN